MRMQRERRIGAVLFCELHRYSAGLTIGPNGYKWKHTRSLCLVNDLFDRLFILSCKFRVMDVAMRIYDIHAGLSTFAFTV